MIKKYDRVFPYACSFSLFILNIFNAGNLNVSKVICLWESLKIQNMSWDWCFHFTEIGPFWYLVSKKFHNHLVIIHLWRLWGCIIAEISKIHWKSMIKKHQYCFANISATKAWIFMKFFVVICLKFHEDLCINAHARVVNACALFEGKLFW